MSAEALSQLTTATLICLPPEGVVPADRLVVGVQLPGSRPIMHRYEAADRSEEIELQWPEPMASKLAEFYEKTYARPAREEWNCHTFGAQVTDNSRSIRLNGARDVANVIQGPETAPTDIENGRLSGVFTRLGHLSHTLVGTQVSGQCLHVVGRKMPLYYSAAAEWQKHYNGTIHPYTYVPREPRAS